MADTNKVNDGEVNEAGSSQPPLDDDEDIMKLGDLIKHQDDMMEEVAAVLGAGDDFNCSYNQGYMKRQALYACLTCVPQGKADFTKAAGFCLACSYHCHDGHNLIELYTKRHFRCDCGNLKFGDVHCNLNPNKEDYNYENVYNQNFCGMYCTCHKPYPDPEDPIEDDMIQCIICEDWYHSRHLDTGDIDNFAEMICETCVKSNEFLMSYAGMAMTKIEAAKSDEHVNITDDKKEVKENGAEVDDKGDTNIPVAKEETNVKESEETKVVDEAAKTEEEDATNIAPTPKTNEETKQTDETSEMETTDHDQSSETTTTDPNCTKPILKDIQNAPPRTLFMKDIKWRDSLCRCTTCMNIYKEHNLLYLLDMEDTVDIYEKKGKENYQDAKRKAIEAEQQMLKAMPRAPLLDALAGINDFKEQLSEYLKQFAEQKKVLTVDDVKQFFSKLNSNKRQKTSETTYFCR